MPKKLANPNLTINLEVFHQQLARLNVSHLAVNIPSNHWQQELASALEQLLNLQELTC